MSICDIKINNDITSPCNNPLYTGKKQKGWLINRDDVASYTLTGNYVTGITLVTGAQAYFIECNEKRPYQGTITAMEDGDTQNTFAHTVLCHMQNDGAEFRTNVIEKLAGGRFVVILENLWGGENNDSFFPVYGLQRGLDCVAETTENVDNGGWDFTLAETGLPMAGLYYWHTDEETSRNDLDALAGGGGGEGWTPKWFYVEDASGAANTLTIKKSNNALANKVFEWSYDKQNWTEITVTDTTGVSLAVPANGRVYIRGDNETLTANNGQYYTRIGCSANYNIGGDLTTLLHTVGSQFYAMKFYLANLFTQSNVVDASALILPATTLASNCCAGMFQGCTALTQAPTLPATTLASDCYYMMFQGCTALTQAPTLPATTLASDCYYMMFQGCTALTQAPTLPATTLANNCYYMMFQGCTALTQAPTLPATTLANNCYREMFYGCTSLTTAPALPATTLASNCYTSMFSGCTALNRVEVYATTWNNPTNWLNGVAATGDFYNLGGATIPTGTNGIPSGWTEHTQLP